MRAVGTSALAVGAVAAALGIAVAPASAGGAVSPVPAAGAFAGHGSSPPPRAGAVVPGELLVRFQAGLPDAAARSLLSARGLRFERRLPNVPNLRLVRLAPGGEGAAARALQRRPEVRYAEPNRYVARFAVVPPDPLFREQWGLRNVGQSVLGYPGTPGADIGTPSAWDGFVAGSEEIPVAVVDTGIALDHPDLASMLWQGPGGVHGHDFINQNSNPYDAADDPDHGHGSLVAGTIAARGLNGTGIAGIGFDPAWNVRLMALRTQTVGQAIMAYGYARDNGARVINYSAGGPHFSQAEKDAIDNAGKADQILFVTAPGNSASNVDASPMYPCVYALDNIVCVAASDQHDRLAGFSSWGPGSVDLAAPGLRVLSTFPAGATAVQLAEGFGEWPLGRRWFRGRTRGQRWRPARLHGSPALAANRRGRFLPRGNTWIRSAPIDLSARRRCVLAFTMRLRTHRRLDRLLVEVTGNPRRRWRKLRRMSGKRGGTRYVRLPGRLSGKRSIYVRFRLLTRQRQRRDGVRIRDAAVYCLTTANTWTHGSGTSFSAPHVAGVAALLWARDPGLTVEEVRAALIGGAAPRPSLAGRVASGGRLSAPGALAAAP